MVGRTATIPILHGEDGSLYVSSYTESPHNPPRSSFIGSDWLEVPPTEESPEHKRARVADAYYRQVYGAPVSTLSAFNSVMKDMWNSQTLANQLQGEIILAKQNMREQINRQMIGTGDPTWKPRKISFLKRKARRFKSAWMDSRWRNALHEIRYHDHDMWD